MTAISSALLLAVVCGASTKGRAQPPEAASVSEPTLEHADARARAMPLFQQGLALVEVQRWSEALDAFEHAYVIFQSPILAFDIAYCHRALGRYVLALHEFEDFLEMDLQGAAASRVEEARGYVHELQQRIVYVIVNFSPNLVAGVELEVDGQPRAVDGPSVRLALTPGHHSVHVRHDGYGPLFEDRDFGPGENLTIDARLDRLPGRVEVRSSVAGARVVLDSVDMGPAPFVGSVPAGHHELLVRAEGYLPHRSTLNLTPGDTANVRATLELRPVPLRRRWWFWTSVVAGMGAAAFAAWRLTRPDPQPRPYDGGSLGWVVTP